MSKWNKILLAVLCVGFAALMGTSAYILFYKKAAPKIKTISMPAPGVAKAKKPVFKNRPLDFTNDFSVVKNSNVPGRKKKASPKKADSYVFYPTGVMKTLGIDMQSLLSDRARFKNTVVHVEWMDRINNTLKNLDPEKKDAMIKNHETLLYIKDKLNKAYLGGKIDFDTFKKSLAALMKWHQKTYEAMLTPKQYETLFEVKPEDAGPMIDKIVEAAPEYSFILNQRISLDEIKKRVPKYKLDEVNTHFKKMALENEELGNKINAGQITLEDARKELAKIQHRFISKCEQILTEDEINTIFGSKMGLESGQVNLEKPKVLGNTDEAELGFSIENPDTSIEMAVQKIDKDKLDDIKFFYQERAKERQKLLDQLNAGKITEDELANKSAELDATYEDSCKQILSDDEYKLLFGKGASSATPGSNAENQAEE